MARPMRRPTLGWLSSSLRTHSHAPQTAPFSGERRRAEQYRTYVQIWSFGVTAIVLLAGIMLAAPFQVYFYISILLALLGYPGVRALLDANQMTLETGQHLAAIAGFLEDKPPRGEFLDFLQATGGLKKEDQSSADARHSAPGLFWTLRHGRFSADRAHSVATMTFAEPQGRLRSIHFFRSALVLGGLFGTVLFFAWELKGSGFGDLLWIEQLLLPSLRGAMACTLTGIATSVGLGHVARPLAEHITRLSLETERLLQGRVADALALEPEQSDLASEAELWSAVREEIRRLREDTATHVTRMADDSLGYAKALKEVADRLASLPSLELPEQLNDLGDVVDRFSVTAKTFRDGAEVMSVAAKSLGTVVPKKVLEELASLEKGGDELKKSVRGVADAQEKTQEKLLAIESEIDQLPDKVAFDDSRLFKEVAEAGSALLTAVGDMEGKLGRVGNDVASIKEAADEWPSAVKTFEAVGAATLEAAKRLSVASGALERLTPELASATERFGSVVGRLEMGAGGIRPTSRFVKALWQFLNRDIFRHGRR